MSSEVIASYQKQQATTTLALENNDSSSEIKQSQNYQSLLSPKNHLMNA
jgi:hypothetical protein